jgi:hypothetical protein
MSVEGSSHLGPDEAIKRQNAELLQAKRLRSHTGWPSPY